MSEIKLYDFVWVDNDTDPWCVEHEDAGGLTRVSKWIRTESITKIPDNFPRSRNEHDTRSQGQEKGSQCT